MVLRKEKAVVIGDLHIGLEFKMVEEGVHFPNSSEKMSNKINKICREAKADTVIFLGDIKDRIGFTTTSETDSLRSFFRSLECKKILIAKGNHDGHLVQILQSLNLDIRIENEFLIGDYAILHGNSWPSNEAMLKKYLIIGHMHPAIKTDERFEKVWIISKIGKRIKGKYENFNKEIKLIMAPAFTDLIVGSGIDIKTKSKLLLFKNEIFQFENSEVYDLKGNLLGKAKELYRN